MQVRSPPIPIALGPASSVDGCCSLGHLRATRARPWTLPWRAWPARSPRSSPPSPSSWASWNKKKLRGASSLAEDARPQCHTHEVPCAAPFPLHRPSALDSFSALSGQVSTLTKQLRVDRASSMQNYVFLPLQFSTEHDPQLEVRVRGEGKVGWEN